MPDLFGLDIAGLVNDSIVSAGGVRSGVLTKRITGVRTPGDLAGGTNPTSTTHSFNGFVERKTDRRNNSVIAEPMSIVSILGASISPIVDPEVNDTVSIDGVTWTLLELISRDPAAALFEFKAES